MRLCHIFALFLCALVLGLSTEARGDRRISLSEAVRLALKNNPQLQLEQAKVEEAEATRKSARGHYGPKVMVEGNVMVWDSALAFEFNSPDPASMDMDAMAAKIGVTPTQLAGTFVKYDDLFTTLPLLFDLGNIRDQVTAQLSVTLAQPLTPLLQVYSGHKATKRMEEAARLDRKAKDTSVAHQVSETYFRLMQARQFTEVAQTGVDQVAAHLKRARHFYTAGLIGKQDVLKAQLELARAKERVIKARTGVSLAGSGLAILMGLRLEEKLVLTEKVVDPPTPFGKGLGECLAQASKKRTELRALERRREAADAGRQRAKWDLIPQLSAVASYQHTQGQGTFMPENAFFAGGVLKWELWDWGGKYYAMKAAGKKARQAELGLRLLRDGIQLQTKKAFLELRQSEEALTVARAAIVEAEENFRIETKRFDANANTSTDVLDAQLALTRSKLSYTTALYGYYIAHTALLSAMGHVAGM